MKNILLASVMLIMTLSASAQKNDVTKEKFTPFYTTAEAPKLEKVLPDPPAFTSARYQDDWAMYQWGKSIRNTVRGQVAIEDAGMNVNFSSYFMKRFSPAIGIELTPEKFPHLFRLLNRAHLTEQQAGASAKKHFARVRPYQQFKEPSSVPMAENPTDYTSYPSGHTHISWLVGMILSVIDPDHTAEIMKIAYEMGQSRVIVGFHYQSDIEAGRVAGSITFARLCAEEEFQLMLNKAITEFKDNITNTQTINKKYDMKDLRNAITETLEKMAQKARSMNMQGVAVASILPKETEVDWIGEMKVVDTPYNPEGGDKGWTLVAIAWSKAGEVIASGADSGNPDRKCMTGELNYTGGAYDETANFKFAFAFSGGLSEDDLAVAKYGISYLKSLLGE